MGLDEYARRMETDPSAIYGIDTGDMMTAQSGSQLPPKETVLRGGFELSVLREKYGLTDERYALLLYNVYQAVAGGGSLALLTQLPLSQTQDLVREVAYCAAMGMLPGLRWRLTCSSAADTRAAICVSSKAGGGGMGIPLCTFDLDDGGRRLEEDPFVAELFRYLASAAPEEAQQLLLDMQYILGELVPLEYASLEMIATAYHMRKMNDGNRPENDVYDRVVGNLLLCGRVPSANQETVNKLLIWMLKRQNAALPKRIMELSVDRCVKQVQADAAGGRELCDCVCRLLQYSRSAEQLELLQKTVKTFDVRYAGLVHALLRGIFSDRACSIDPQTACSLIPEMLRSGDEMLTGDCVELTTCLDAGQCRQLAESILRHVGLRQMTLMEQNVLANILDELSRSGGVLGKESCEILDRNSCVYNGRLLDACVGYLVQVRLRQELPVEERCALLAGLEREYPALYDDVAAALKSGGSILWKKYQIHKHLQNCRCYEDIVAARRSYQGASPMDDFEQECVALWMQLLRRDVYQGMPLKNLVPQMGRAVDALPRGVFSLEAAHELQRRQRAYFWSCMTYRTMMDYVLDGAPSSNVQALLQTRDSGADGNKLHFLDAVWQLYRDPSRTEPMTELVLDGHLPARDREEICNLLLPLAAKLKAASNQAMFAWDLMLLSCSRVEAGRVVYDCGSLIKKIEGIPALKMGVSGSQSLQLEHSVILRDEKVRSDPRKAAGRGKEGDILYFRPQRCAAVGTYPDGLPERGGCGRAAGAFPRGGQHGDRRGGACSVEDQREGEVLQAALASLETDTETTLSDLQTLSQAGNAYASYQLGLYYSSHEMEGMDTQQVAQNFFNCAAQQGYGPGYGALADYALNGRRKNLRRAAQYFGYPTSLAGRDGKRWSKNAADLLAYREQNVRSGRQTLLLVVVTLVITLLAGICSPREFAMAVPALVLELDCGVRCVLGLVMDPYGSYRFVYAALAACWLLNILCLV